MKIKTQNEHPKKTPQTSKRTPKRITETYLHNAGLYYLQRYAASAQHFRSVLLRKVKRSLMHDPAQDSQHCRGLVETIVEKFERSGLLNDSTYIQGMISSLRRQGRSQKYIVQKLMHKGIEAKTAQAALQRNGSDDSASEDEELQAARKFVQKKNLNAQDPDKALQKLARAGFSYDTARKALQTKDDY